jgi:hypothetical protein
MATKEAQDLFLYITCVGVIYAILLMALRAIFGNEAVGLASIGLTTLATLAIKKYKRSDPSLDAQPEVNWWTVILLALAFVGLQPPLGQLHAILHSFIPSIPDLQAGNVTDAVVLLCFAYALSGVLALKALPRLTPSKLAFAILISYCFSFVYQIDGDLFHGNWKELRSVLAASARFQVFVVLYAAIGVAPLFLARLSKRAQANP